MKERFNIKKLYDEYILIKSTSLFKIFVVLVAICVPLFIEREFYSNEIFNIYRYMLFEIVFQFIGFHFIFNIRKIYDWIYKYRYIIGISLFSFFVIFGYHGSSIAIYNQCIDTNNEIVSSNPIVGVVRSIRSDEWRVNATYILSQASSLNNYSSVNHTMMGGINNLVNFYPKLPTADFSLLFSPRYIGFLLLPLEQGYSFYWYFDIFALFFASFELFMILTKKKKMYALAGASLITFAPAIQWWECFALPWTGFASLVLLYKFLNTDKFRNKILYSIVIGYFGTIFVLQLYPAWMIPLSYLYLSIIVWMLIDNKGKYGVRDLLMLISIVLLIVGGVFGYLFYYSKDVFELMSNTVYPGARFEQGGNSWEHLFNYVNSFYLLKETGINSSEASQFFSLYPLPLLFGIYILIKNFINNKKDYLLILLVSVLVFLNLYNFVVFPKWLAKITFLYMTPASRMHVMVGLISTILLIVLIANYATNIKLKKENIKSILLITIVSLILPLLSIYYAKVNLDDMSNEYLILLYIICSLLHFLILLDNKKIKVFLCLSLIVISAIIGGKVHPISVGIDVMYDKPLAKEVRKIVKRDSNERWLVVNTSILYNNYILANGAKLVNSTNYYPNYDVWNILDKKKEYESVWNRYSHMSIVLDDFEKTTVELLHGDHIQININPKDVCRLKVKYLVATGGLEQLNNKYATFKRIYEGDNNINIYDIKCAK